MVLKTVCTVYFFKDAAASLNVDNKFPFNKKNTNISSEYILNNMKPR